MLLCHPILIPTLADTENEVMPPGHSCGLYMTPELKLIIPQRHSRGSIAGNASLTYCGEDGQIGASRGQKGSKL